MVLRNGVGQIHNVVHPDPTQKILNDWNIFKTVLKTQILEEPFYSNSLHKKIWISSFVVFVLLHLDQLGLDPLEFLQKAGSGVVVLQNGVGQMHNVFHPNPTQRILNDWNIFKNYWKARFWKSFLKFFT